MRRLDADLTSDVSLDPAPQFFAAQPLREQKDQLGVESFERHVMGADSPALGESVT